MSSLFQGVPAGRCLEVEEAHSVTAQRSRPGAFLLRLSAEIQTPVDLGSTHGDAQEELSL